MLNARTVHTPAGTTYVLVENLDECQVCHRNAWRCNQYPWPNHHFIPATASADNLPAAWEILPLHIADDERPHRAS